MKNFDELSPAQERWVVLVEYCFPAIYQSGQITHKELIKVHAQFLDMREQDKKYKVGWPIWLISNNAITRGVYQIPQKDFGLTQQSGDLEELNQEMKEFGVV